jgi:hypothetical protein
MFLSLLLMGGDLIALHAGGLTLRLVFPVLMLAFAFLFQRIGLHIVFDRTLAFLFFLLSVAAAASVGGTLDVVKSIGYTIWILFDFFVIVGLPYNFAKLYPAELTLKLWFVVYRIHAGLLLVELLRNVLLYHSTDRPHLWFYETSYLAIFMTGYFGSALFMLLRHGRTYGWEFFLSLVCIAAAAFLMAFFSIFLALQLESTFLRYYLWTPLGLGLGILARSQAQAAPKEDYAPLPAPAPA